MQGQQPTDRSPSAPDICSLKRQLRDRAPLGRCSEPNGTITVLADPAPAIGQCPGCHGFRNKEGPTGSAKGRDLHACRHSCRGDRGQPGGESVCPRPLAVEFHFHLACVFRLCSAQPGRSGLPASCDVSFLTLAQTWSWGLHALCSQTQPQPLWRFVHISELSRCSPSGAPGHACTAK